MKIRAFVNHLRERVDAAAARGHGPDEICAVFAAPSSGFCGPHFRPHFRGDGPDAVGRYSLSVRQGRLLLYALTHERPPASKSTQDAGEG